jgi:hypothetical protein
MRKLMQRAVLITLMLAGGLVAASMAPIDDDSGPQVAVAAPIPGR